MFNNSSFTTSKLAEATSTLKLSQIQVQITQIWAITASSLGLKWNVFQLNAPTNDMSLILNKINGFYIYYRKLDADTPPVAPPLYNYTRLNLPISERPQQALETHMIANLERESQYEIKMTCYNLNGDLCAFSNTVTGLTLSSQPLDVLPSSKSVDLKKGESVSNVDQVVLLKSKQNELLFMILGIVLGVLTLLLVIFVGMCLLRHRQHKRLLAQLQNTSQKMTSSSCPTLIYEDSLRQQANTSHLAQHRLNLNYGNKLLDLNHHHNQPTTSGAGSICGNDSNSTNSQSMSTTTSSMTTPPALNSAQTNSELTSSAQMMSHVLMLNGNTVTSSAAPPIPVAPPPSIFNSANSNSTLNRMHINLNPLNTYLESSSSLGLANNNNTRYIINYYSFHGLKMYANTKMAKNWQKIFYL